MQPSVQLLANIIAQPEARDPYLVYSDWLQSHGDPRGELIAVQLGLADGPDPALAAREQELLAAHAADWLGELAKVEPQYHAVTWRYGFVREIRLGPPLDEYRTYALDTEALFASIAALPHLELLERLVVGASATDGWTDPVDEIVDVGIPPSVRVLEIDCGGYWDISTTFADLSKAYARLANVRTLRVRLGHLRFGAIDLPHLRSLVIETGGLDKRCLASFRAARWPALETLSLCIGSSGSDYGCDVAIEDLQWIFDGENLDGVRHLGLANSNLADDIAHRLAGSKILGQLESLDLSRGYLSDTGISSLLADPRVRHLKKLDLHDSYITDLELLAKLDGLGIALDLTNQQPGDEDNRYCQISE